MSAISPEQSAQITAFLSGHHISAGLGTKEAPCSVAAINLALTGVLTDDIPACMSEVVGRWIIAIQDPMPDVLRNSAEWRELLPLAAGTGRAHEQERARIIIYWLDEILLHARRTNSAWSKEFWWSLRADVPPASVAGRLLGRDVALLLRIVELVLGAGAWSVFNPAALLARLIAVGQD